MNDFLEGYNFISFPKCPIRLQILDWSQVKCILAVIKHHLINPFQWRVGLVLKTHLRYILAIANEPDI